MPNDETPRRAVGAAPARQTRLVRATFGGLLVEQGGTQRQFGDGGRLWNEAWIVAEMFTNEGGGGFAGHEQWVLQQIGEETLVAVHAQQHAVLHRAQQLAPRFVPGG